MSMYARGHKCIQGWLRDKRISQGYKDTSYELICLSSDPNIFPLSRNSMRSEHLHGLSLQSAGSNIFKGPTYLADSTLSWPTPPSSCWAISSFGTEILDSGCNSMVRTAVHKDCESSLCVLTGSPNWKMGKSVAQNELTAELEPLFTHLY